MKMRTIKLLLWAILLMLLGICIKVIFIGYEMPTFWSWLTFALPIVSILLAVFSWFRDYIDSDD